MSASYTDKLQEINFKEHVSSFLSFHDPQMSREYQLFKVAQSNTVSFIPLHLCSCFFFLFGSFNGLMLSFDWYNILTACVCSFFNVFVGNLIIAMHFKNSLFGKESIGWKLLTWAQSFRGHLESLWIFGCALDLCFVTGAIVHNGECPASIEHVKIARGCNYSGNAQEIPMDLVMALFFAPIICAVVLKGGSFLSVAASIGINAGTLFATMYFFSMYFEGPIIILFNPMCMLVLYEFQRQTISVFLLARNQTMLLEEIDRLSNQTAKELRSMIGNVAHDLKTPMSAFMSGLDLITHIMTDIENKSNRSEEVVRGLKAISESITNMKNINSFMRMSINRCIDFTKASNGMVLVPRMETVDFREMLQLPLNCMKNLQDGKVAIELLPIDPDVASHVITDPQWFQENVLCLLSNAVKYSAEGVVSIAVSLLFTPPSTPTAAGTEKSDDKRAEPVSMIRIDIIDTGIGISDDLKPRLFSPFKQAQRLAGGTGLGLYSLAKRMEALGGKYGVRNRLDGQQGSDFWFSFPYRPADAVEKLAVQDDCLEAEEDEEPKNLNILLVDDSISILKMSSKVLTKLGHSVTTAENGAVALKLMSSTFVANASSKDGELLPKFDVVLMDLQMPIMDGLEATKRLRALEEDLAGQGEVHHQIIIGVSANSDHETTLASFDAGVDDFIPKPFNMKTFEAVYQRLLNKRRVEFPSPGNTPK